ncbi:MAG: transketolase [Magnetococcales bacterium]|nr:transketolase [Magnetococcales bacterium]
MDTPTEPLLARSQWLRKALFEMAMGPKKGHIPSSFSMVEILVTLYFGGVARHFQGEPDHPDRDRIFVSKGHAGMAQYPIFAELGYFPREELDRFTQPEGLLGMYPDFRVPGIEGVSGSLGHGVGIGAGIAHAAKLDGKSHRAFAILGDGECYEGSVWESALFAAHHCLDNLVVVVDRNQLCIMGKTEELLALGDLRGKWESFGWHALSVDGHSYPELLEAFSHIGRTHGKPLVIIANTVKGKGISFMELAHLWHNRMPNKAQMAQARAELERNPIS